MEDYNNQVSDNNNETASRGSFLYGTSYSHNNNQLPISFHQHNHLQTSDHGYPSVKMEAGNSQHKFQYPFIYRSSNHHQQEERREENEKLINGSADEAIKAKIIAHPQYSSLLQAYMDCQKVGAPAEVVARLAAVRQEFEARRSESGRETCKDPELDQFMEAYYDMLVKYREELTRPLQEATEFMRRIETQLNMLSTGPLRIFSSGSLSPRRPSSQLPSRLAVASLQL